MFRRLKVKLYMRNNSGNTGATAPLVQSSVVRLLFWTPRVNYEQAASHMNGLQSQSIPDFNQVTIHREKIVYLGAPYIDGEVGVTGVISGGTAMYDKLLDFSFAFPRKAKFPAGSAIVNPDKDVMYLTIIVGYLPIALGLNCKLTYCDS